MELLTKIFGTKHDRDIKKMDPVVEEINQHFESFAGLSDAALKKKTDAFRNRLQGAMKDVLDQIKFQREDLSKMGHDDPERQILLDEIEGLEAEVQDLELEELEAILPEVYAVFKETCRRFKEAEKSWERAGEQITWDMVPYDVQLTGATVLHQGKITEWPRGRARRWRRG